jgi:streptomycin 6-kinase
LIVPDTLAENAGRSAEGREWLARLPDTIAEITQRWTLEIGPPFEGPEVSAAWVAPVRRIHGTAAVLKLGFPHMEGEREIDGLRVWNGDPTVRLLEADDAVNAMLLERCEPGTTLRERPEEEQDVVIARLLRRLWRSPPDPHPFRPLSEMIAAWSRETLTQQERWPDPGLVREGLEMFDALLRDGEDAVLLGTDVHAGNVLSSQREPWLVIDPKPFVGDRTYDATQHLANCEERMRTDPRGTISKFSDLLEVDAERVRLWMFGRFAAEPRDVWDEDEVRLARRLSA